MWANTGIPRRQSFNFQRQMVSPSVPQSPYPNSPLLSELHTLFPAFLYEANRFTSTQSVFQYIQARMREQYDTYTAMRNTYNEQRRQRRQQQQQAYTTQYSYVPYTAATTTPSTTSESAVNALMAYLLTQNLFADPVTNHMLRSIPPSAASQGVRVSADFMEPVPVTPTPQQIANASHLSETTGQMERPCAICQDEIAQGTTVRTLTHCNHYFHQGCIDTWFARNTHCPVCRHDVRTTVAMPS
jgi:hypothetical protein